MAAAHTLNADYTATPAKCVLLRAIYRLGALLFLLLMRHRIGRLAGLEHLPRQGPFIIVANHLSYMDDFLLAYVVRLCCGQRLYIPTNTKAFKGVLRSWLHLAGGAVEIDPADRETSNQALRQLVHDGRIVLMFPEGTRSDGTRLLPFKFGAFNLAIDTGVPLVPVALLGTHQVLPKGRLWPLAGAQASAVVLPPVLPGDVHGRDAVVMRERCQQLISAHALCGNGSAPPPLAEATARALAERAEAHVEALIERGPETIRPADLWPVFRLAMLCQHARRGCCAMQVQVFRAWGFWLLCAPRLLAPLLLLRFHRLAALALQRDAQQPFVHYVLGQFHLRAPWLAGGRRQQALRALAQAYGAAPAYGVPPERFAISYAEALLRNGHPEQARVVLLRHFHAAPGATDTRLQRRAQRAADLLASLPSLAGMPTRAG